MSSFYEHISTYFLQIVIFYIVIDLLFALLISFYALKRFKTSNSKIDDERLLKTRERGLIYKTLFRLSLHKNNQLMIFLFVFFFNLAIPIAGFLFSIWLFWYMVNVKYEKKISNIATLNLEEFDKNFLKVERIFGEGSMINLLNNPYIPQQKKIRALVVLSENPSPVSLNVIKTTLSSKEDEVRLYGYAILNKMEKSLNSKINKNLNIIQEEKKNGNTINQKIAFASKELAFLYWEMIYTELSNEGLRDSFLDTSISYLNIAQEYYTKKLSEINKKILDGDKSENIAEQFEKIKQICSSIYILRGRIYIYKKRYDEAQEVLTLAKELIGEKSTSVLPYLAEIYYITRRFRIVHSILNYSDDLILNPKLYPVIEQWRG